MVIIYVGKECKMPSIIQSVLPQWNPYILKWQIKGYHYFTNFNIPGSSSLQACKLQIQQWTFWVLLLLLGWDSNSSLHTWGKKIKSDANSWEFSNVSVFSVVYFHCQLLLDFRAVFVEIKLPILLYYWKTNFFIRGDEKFLFFHPVKAIVRTDKANSIAFLQREFLPSNDTYTTKTSAWNTSFPAFVYLHKTLKPQCSKVNKKATMMYFIGSSG